MIHLCQICEIRNGFFELNLDYIQIVKAIFFFFKSPKRQFFNKVWWAIEPLIIASLSGIKSAHFKVYFAHTLDRWKKAELTNHLFIINIYVRKKYRIPYQTKNCLITQNEIYDVKFFPKIIWISQNSFSLKIPFFWVFIWQPSKISNLFWDAKLSSNDEIFHILQLRAKKGEYFNKLLFLQTII